MRLDFYNEAQVIRNARQIFSSENDLHMVRDLCRSGSKLKRPSYMKADPCPTDTINYSEYKK